MQVLKLCQVELEILNDRIRQKLCPNKATAQEWLEVSRTAHQLGIKTNASMLYGHIETIRRTC